MIKVNYSFGVLGDTKIDYGIYIYNSKHHNF